MTKLDLEDGKYTIIVEASGGMHALRYGKWWRDLTGDKLVGALFNLVCEQLTATAKQADSDATKVTS